MSIVGLEGAFIGITLSELNSPCGETRKKLASEFPCRELLDALPVAVYTTGAAGRITYYNAAAVRSAGRRFTIGSNERRVTWQLYRPDGAFLPHNECPMPKS